MVSHDPAMQAKHRTYMEQLSPKNQRAARVLALDLNRKGQWARMYPDMAAPEILGVGGQGGGDSARYRRLGDAAMARGDRQGASQFYQTAASIDENNSRMQHAGSQNRIAEAEMEGNREFRKSQIQLERDKQAAEQQVRFETLREHYKEKFRDAWPDAMRADGYQIPGDVQPQGQPGQPGRVKATATQGDLLHVNTLAQTNEYLGDDAYNLLDNHIDTIKKLTPGGLGTLFKKKNWTKDYVAQQAAQNIAWAYKLGPFGSWFGTTSKSPPRHLENMRVLLRKIGVPEDKLPRKAPNPPGTPAGSWAGWAYPDPDYEKLILEGQAGLGDW